MKRLAILLVLLAVAALACRQEKSRVPGGDSKRGRQLVESQYVCGACHSIPGINGPKGMVGPPLDHIAQRQMIGGRTPNNPDNMIRWLQNPQAFDPAIVMPNMGIDEKDARDIAAFLYTLQ